MLELKYRNIFKIQSLLIVAIAVIYQLLNFFQSSNISTQMQLLSCLIVLGGIAVVTLVTRRIYIKVKVDHIELKLSPLKPVSRIYYYDISEVKQQKRKVCIRYGSSNKEIRIPVSMFRDDDANELVSKICLVIV